MAASDHLGSQFEEFRPLGNLTQGRNVSWNNTAFRPVAPQNTEFEAGKAARDWIMSQQGRLGPQSGSDFHVSDRPMYPTAPFVPRQNPGVN